MNNHIFLRRSLPTLLLVLVLLLTVAASSTADAAYMAQGSHKFSGPSLQPAANAFRTTAGSESRCQQLLQNTQLDVSEGGSYEPWFILTKGVLYSSDIYQSPQHSLYMVDDDDGSGYPDEDAFAQIIQVPANLESVVIEYATYTVNANDKDQSGVAIWGLDDEDWPLWTIYSQPVLDSEEAWATRTIEITNPTVLQKIAGNAIAVGFWYYPYPAAPAKIVYLDDITFTACKANQEPVLSDVEVTPQAIQEGDSITLSGGMTDDEPEKSLTLELSWGDGESETQEFDPGTTSFTFDHTYEDDNPSGTPVDPYTIHLKLSDEWGAFTTETAVVQVSNLPPTIDAGPDRTVIMGQSESFTALVTDPGTADTHTMSWDFGDGSPPVEGINVAHTYEAAGSYTVTVTVTDDDGGSTIDTIQVDVIEIHSLFIPVILVP